MSDECSCKTVIVVLIISFACIILVLLVIILVVNLYWKRRKKTSKNIFVINCSLPSSYIVKKMRAMIPQRLTPTVMDVVHSSLNLNRRAAQTNLRFERVVDCCCFLSTVVILHSVNIRRIGRGLRN